MDGNVQNIEPHAYSRYEPGTEEYDFEEELRKNKEDNAIIFIFYEGTDTEQFPIATTIPAIKNIYDYDELKAYLQNNGCEAFVLPDYIPAGFEFSSASISLTLSATAHYEAFEPAYREEKFGNAYEKYLLPEEQTCAESIIVSYSNGKIYLSCIIRFSENSLVFGRSSEVDKEPEVIDIPQFERSLIMSYENGLINPNPMWAVLAERRMDEPVSILNTIFIGKSFRETYMNKLRTRKCRYVNYSIDSTSTLFSGVSREEIIKVANSIK